eukprot:scaffold14.g1145.t1
MSPHVLLLGLLLALACCVAATDWKDGTWKDGCPGSPLQVKQVTLTPEPIKPGDTAQFEIQAVAGQVVPAGTVSMVVHYAGVPIWVQTDQLCAKVDSCPIQPGAVSIKYSQIFPAITPPGPYSMTLTGHGAAGGPPLFCVDVNFQVGAAAPPTDGTAAGSGGGSVSGGSGSGGASIVQLPGATKGAAQQVLRAHRKQVA